MRRGRGQIEVARAAEHPEMLIGGCDTEKSDVRASCADRLCGETVQQVLGSVESLNPVACGNRSLEKQRVDDIINGTNSTLSFTILWRGVWTRYVKQCSM